MEKLLLDTIQSPHDLKKMDYRDLELLCKEIREFLIESLSKTGGHLSSNLGVVEATVAWHRIYNSPHDMLVFDVGHQCYTHKILTGRKAGFEKLRKLDGMSGFPAPSESKHDLFLAGHGSTSISAAIGLARAKKMKNEPGKVFVLIGDGAFTGGMIYEAINNISGLDNLVVMLNDNTMSISKNVGSLAHYFTKLRTSAQYFQAKQDVKQVLEHTPVIGSGVAKGIQSVKSMLRRNIYHSTFFEELGFQYIGPMNGHNLPLLCNVFMGIRTAKKPVFIHLETVKGKGFVPAEKNPGAFHGVSSFNTRQLADPDLSPGDSFSNVFGQALAAEGEANPKICAITAAMKYGTGLQFFKKQHPERFFDVGMAEGHAVTFAGGLAANGMLPVAAIYSTFLQRGYDQLIHDVSLQGLNVLFAIDRAGFVPGDGETHQGIYDAAYLSQQRDMLVASPSNYAELTCWLNKLLQISGPRAIRYPRGKEPASLAAKPCTGNAFDKLLQQENAKAALVTYGTLTEDVLQAAEKLSQAGKAVDVYQLVLINPLPEGLIPALKGYDKVFFAEEGIARGGIGEHVAIELLKAGFAGQYRHYGVIDNRITHAEVPEIKKMLELDAEGLCRRVSAEWGEE